MSRHYGRGSYHRRGSAVCQTSFSIDKLFKESSNKPSASRSAGTVGKWGITSFTTIRGSGFGSRLASSARNETNVKQETSVPEGDIKAKEDQAPKPKKFFKSRNAGGTSATQDLSTQPAIAPVRKPDKIQGSKVSPPKSSPQTDDEYKPPIVLRIFKGTSCIVADDSCSPPRQSPRGDKSPGSKGRRRSTHDNEPSWSPKTRRRSAADESSTPISPRPKRTRREVIKDPAIQSIISQLISDDESEESGFESQQKSESGPCITQPCDDNSEDSMPLSCWSTANKENEIKIIVAAEETPQEALDLAKSSAVKTEVADPVQFEKETAEDEEEDDEDESDSQDQGCDSGVVLTSQVESGGLKLVIKKAPEHHVEPVNEAMETEPADSEENVEIEPVGLKLVIKKTPQHEPEIVHPGADLPKAAPVKKKSIFKSRRMDDVGNAKRLALYKHNWSSQQTEPATASDVTKAASLAFSTEHEFSDAPLARVSAELRPGSPAEDISKVKCDKRDKEYYTVIRNVKKAHQIQESGEFQEFNDDVDYILDALQETNPMGTRCLSAITLAGKCMAPAFRMHVRAHGTVAKFFKMLHDATHDQSLGLCTATVMFVLSQDRLNMDLDRDSLELMLNLLECDASHKNALDDCGMSSAQLRKTKEKVKELCAEIQGKGLAKHLNLENITVGQLAMETLLSLTSKRAGEWFKEELRELGGLDHIVQTISECARSLDTYISQWTDPLLERLRKIDRCLRVLENVTSQNEENQGYLLRYQGGLLLSTVTTLYKVCNDEIALYPCTDAADKVSTGFVLREALLSTLKVLIQLTQEYNKKLYSQTLVDGRGRLMESSLHLLLQVPKYIPEEEKFEFIVLVLTLLINLVEDNEDNRAMLMASKAPPDPEAILETREQLPAVEALVQMYYAHEKRALDEEAQTDAILDGKKEEGAEEAPAKSKGDEIEETIAKLLKRAGNHMEHTFIGAYIAILLGYLIMDSKPREAIIRGFVPGNRFTQIIAVLDKFVNFMKMTAVAIVSSSQHFKATDRILTYYNGIEKEDIKKLEEIKEEPTDLTVAALYDHVLDYTMP